MENSQALATDSFSYSWLINRKPSFDSLVESISFRPSIDSSFESSIKEVMHLAHDRTNKFSKENQEFDFNIHPNSVSSFTLVHADEIFSEGCIMPVYANRSKIEASTSVPATPVSSSLSARTGCSSYQNQYHFLRKLTKSSNRILQKFLASVKPFCQRLGCTRKHNRVDDLDRKVWEVRSRSSSLQPSPDRKTAYSSVHCTEVKQISNKADVYKRLQNVKSCSNSPQASPWHSPPHSMDTWRDIESSIDEAILHCKRSFAK